MKKYALMGVAGYIAERHLRAIKETGGQLVAACDISDSVGILDSYFPDCEFFTSPERFERHLLKLDDRYNAVDYFVVCTPNYLHDNHISIGLRAGADVICEKPMVIKSKNVIQFMNLADKCGKKINVIQQMRLHPAIKDLDLNVLAADNKFDVELNYYTPRGAWYHQSWKGDKEKSGGLAMNIGVHFFDLLISLFGDVVESNCLLSDKTIMCGELELKKAFVRWTLRIGPGKPTRELIINEQIIDLSHGFEDLHTKSYEEILAGRGFGPEDVLPSLKLINNL